MKITVGKQYDYILADGTIRILILAKDALSYRTFNTYTVRVTGTSGVYINAKNYQVNLVIKQWHISDNTTTYHEVNFGDDVTNTACDIYEQLHDMLNEERRQ